MQTFRQAISTLLVCAVIAACSGGALRAEPQDPADGTASSVTRIKQRLNTPPAPRLAPKQPVQLRPTYRSRTSARPWVPTLEEHLRDTFTLTDFQRQYARYAAQCCGLDLGALFRGVDQALDERRTRQVREEIRRELADLETARAAQVR